MNPGSELKHSQQTGYVTFCSFWGERGCLRGRLSHTTKALDSQLSVLNFVLLAREAIKGLRAEEGRVLYRTFCYLFLIWRPVSDGLEKEKPGAK